MTTNDIDTIPLATLQVKVFLRGAQMSDPEMASALQMFRRAANILARLEDAVVFRGLADNNRPPANATAGLQAIWEILGGKPSSRGLLPEDATTGGEMDGNQLVSSVSHAVGVLEGRGHFGPFTVVLDPKFFLAVQTPNDDSLVLPQDRIIPFLGGGSLLRSSTLPEGSGMAVALGGAPIELVVATDVSLNFLIRCSSSACSRRWSFASRRKTRLRRSSGRRRRRVVAMAAADGGGNESIRDVAVAGSLCRKRGIACSEDQTPSCR